MHTAVILGLICTGAWGATPECDATLSTRDATAIRAVIEAYRTSWLRGDAKGVLATFTPDAVLLPAHGARPVVGTTAITNYWWPADGPPFTITKLEITVEAVEGDCRIAYVYGRDDVAWRIARHMWDDAPSP